jgi:hypothetical protein
VTLVANDITAAGGAILASPAFTGTPTAPNPPPGDSSTRIATTAYVQTLAGFAPIASPAFTGVPTAPTAAPGNNTQQIATTAFVEAAIANSTAGVASFNGRTGAVTLQANDLSAAGGALLASPVFTGTPTAPTAALGVNTTQLATCAYVTNAVQAGVANYLPLTGGTLTGILTVPNGGGLTINGANLSNRSIVGETNGVIRWILALGTGASETGSNAGSGFAVTAYSDTGALIGNALTVNRSNLAAIFPSGYLAVQAGIASVSPGVLLLAASGAVQSQYYFDTINSFAIVSFGSTWHRLNSDGSFQIFSQTATKPTGGSWTAPASDARTKTVLGDYAPGLEEVLALRPVRYTFKGNDTTSADLNARVSTAPPLPRATRAPFPSSPHYQLATDGTPCVGFIAQELELACPDMVTTSAGFIDGEAVSDLRQVDVSNLVYVLVNAVKTLAARVTALEAA